MRSILLFSTRLSLVVAALACVALSGCGGQSSPEATAPTDKIAQIESNSSLSPSIKATAIAAEKAKQGSSTAK